MCRFGLSRRYSDARTMPQVHPAMIAVDGQTNPLSRPLTFSLLMISLFAVINIITIIIGTAAIPLIMALQ